MIANPLSLILQAASRRFDGWVNPWTGFGTSRDKTTAGEFDFSPRITDPELTALYKDDGLARKVVNVVPRETWRQGFYVESKDPNAAEGIKADLARLEAQARFMEAQIWARLYGGAVIFMGANDDQEADQPLLEDRIRQVSFLQIYDRRYAIPEKWYRNPQHPLFGKPETFRLTSLEGSSAVVHESRLIIFRGAHTDIQTRKVQLGWDSSIIQATYEAIRAFWANHKAVELLVSDASQGVFKIRGFLSQIAAGNLKDLQTRAALMDQSRSVARAVMIDADGGEEFSKVQTTFAGLPDVLDRSANLVSAVTEIPVTLLMGQAPAGLNATGDVDLRTFYDRIKSDQLNDALPRLGRLVSVLSKARRINAPISVRFPSLWQETPKEKAEREKLEADRDAVLIVNEIATPEDLAPRWGFKPSTEPTVSQTSVLNGAQISSAIAVVQSVVAGTMPRDAGLEELQVLFNLSAEQALEIMGTAGLVPVNPPPSPNAATNPAQ